MQTHEITLDLESQRRFMTNLTKWFSSILVSSTMIFGAAVAQTAGSSSLNDPMFPWMGNGGYDALDYMIDLRFGIDKKTVVGSTTIQAKALQDLSSFNLDFGQMTVSNVVVNGVSARFSQADPELTIVPEKPLVKGQDFSVSIVYSGAPGSKATEGSDSGMWTIGQAGLFALGEPSIMFTWSPVNEIPSDKATFTLKMTAPKAETAVSNGEQISRQENADGSATTTYRVGVPTASYFIVLVVGNWKLEQEAPVGTTRVRHYLAPGTTPTMRKALAETGNILKFLSEKLVPYPYAEVGAITSDTVRGFALETQGLVSMPVSFGRGETFELAAEVMAHELAH
jgi:aminopeptidase N